MKDLLTQIALRILIIMEKNITIKLTREKNTKKTVVYKSIGIRKKTKRNLVFIAQTKPKWKETLYAN